MPDETDGTRKVLRKMEDQEHESESERVVSRASSVITSHTSDFQCLYTFLDCFGDKYPHTSHTRIT